MLDPSRNRVCTQLRTRAILYAVFSPPKGKDRPDDQGVTVAMGTALSRDQTQTRIK